MAATDDAQPADEPPPAATVAVPRRDLTELRSLIRGLLVAGVVVVGAAAFFFVRQEATDRRLEREAEDRCRGFVEGWRLLGDEFDAEPGRVERFIHRLDEEGLLVGCPPDVLPR